MSTQANSIRLVFAASGASAADQQVMNEAIGLFEAEVRERMAEAIESMINEADLSASQSAANEALRMAARIARGK